MDPASSSDSTSLPSTFLASLLAPRGIFSITVGLGGTLCGTIEFLRHILMVGMASFATTIFCAQACCERYTEFSMDYRATSKLYNLHLPSIAGSAVQLVQSGGLQTQTPSRHDQQYMVQGCISVLIAASFLTAWSTSQ